MKFKLTAATMIFASGVALAWSATEQVAKSPHAGVRDITARSMERGSDLAVMVWYPAQEGGVPVTLGETFLFEGTPALRDAQIQNDKYPLILLSHGAGLSGSAEALSWIAGPLAMRGFIVAAPTHPGNGGVSRSAEETMKLWKRPADITATLDAVLRDDFLKDHMLQGKIGMLGLSMGGNTALAVTGARLDPARIETYCDTDDKNMSLCGWVRISGVDLRLMDLSSAGRDNRDSRIKFAMAIDPAPIDVFDPDSFSGISIPVELINLGTASEISSTTNAASAARAIPDSSYLTIDDASHYSMFADCKPGTDENTLREMIGDPVCTDANGRTREEIHKQLIDKAANSFDRALGDELEGQSR